MILPVLILNLIVTSFSQICDSSCSTCRVGGDATECLTCSDGTQFLMNENPNLVFQTTGTDTVTHNNVGDANWRIYHGPDIYSKWWRMKFQIESFVENGNSWGYAFGITRPNAPDGIHDWIGEEINGWGYVGLTGQQCNGGCGARDATSYPVGSECTIEVDTDNQTIKFFIGETLKGNPLFTNVNHGETYNYFRADVGVATISTGKWRIVSFQTTGQCKIDCTPPEGQYLGKCVDCVSLTEGAFYLDELSGDCKNCSTGCLECYSDQNCINCRNGYFVNDGHCFACGNSLNCLKCSDDTSCSECEETGGFGFDPVTHGCINCKNVGLVYVAPTSYCEEATDDDSSSDDDNDDNDDNDDKKSFMWSSWPVYIGGSVGVLILCCFLLCPCCVIMCACCVKRIQKKKKQNLLDGILSAHNITSSKEEVEMRPIDTIEIEKPDSSIVYKQQQVTQGKVPTFGPSSTNPVFQPPNFQPTPNVEYGQFGGQNPPPVETNMVYSDFNQSANQPDPGFFQEVSEKRKIDMY